jgi:hypothetical protein
MRWFQVAACVFAALLRGTLAVASDSPERPALPPEVRVYQVGKTVAEFPEVEDLSTPEAAYANFNRLSVSESPNAWRAFTVKRIRDRLPAPETGKQEVRPEVVRRRLAARIVEVRVFRETYAVVLAETRMKFHAYPDERTVIDVRHLELEDGQWLNVGQDVVDSVERGRLIFARMCAGHIRKPTRPKVDDPEASLKPFVEFLKMHGEDPKAFVMKALAAHQVVIMGEVHHRPRYWAFNASLVEDPEFAKSVGTIYMELPPNDQRLVDAFLAAGELDRMPVIEMLRDVLWMGWPDQAMLDFFVAVWTVNRGLPAEERLRIVLVDMQRPWKEVQKAEDWQKYTVDRDATMAENLLRDRREHPEEVRNAFFIVGMGHAALNLNRPTYPPLPDPIECAGWHLEQALGRENVYAIFPHMPIETNAGRVDGRLCLGLFGSAFGRIGNRPVAFPLGTGPFGEARFDAFPEREVASTYRDGYDAYLYLGPLEEESFSPLIPGFYTDEFVKELDRRYRMMYGKGLVEAGVVKRLDPESFIGWMSRGWGKPRREWQRQNLGPVNAWQYGDNWQEEMAKPEYPRAFGHPEIIREAADKLFAAIRSADYDNPGDWREFPPGQPYRVRTNYPRWVAWVCQNFGKNPIQSVELGDVLRSDGRLAFKVTRPNGSVREGEPARADSDRPAVPYTLTLQDGTMLEGVLPFYYNARSGSWSGDRGLDWHMVEPSLDLSPAPKQSP